MGIKIFTPSVDKKILILLAGIMWCGVGVMLNSLAISWLLKYTIREQILSAGAGFLAAMPIHHFGFLKLADKNLIRLLALRDKRCLFSFVTWKSYLIIIFMVSLGITLRHSSIPKNYLSVLYIGIGLGLFLSGIRYFRYFFKLLLAQKP